MDRKVSLENLPYELLEKILVNMDYEELEQMAKALKRTDILYDLSLLKQIIKKFPNTLYYMILAQNPVVWDIAWESINISIALRKDYESSTSDYTVTDKILQHYTRMDDSLGLYVKGLINQLIYGAIKTNKLLLFSILLKYKQDPVKRETVSLIVQNDQIDMFKLLLDNGYTLDHYEAMRFAKATLFNTSYKILEYLIDNYLTQQDIYDLLSKSIQENLLGVVHSLINKYLLDVSKLNDKDELLWEASRSGHLEMVKLLLQHGANINYQYTETASQRDAMGYYDGTTPFDMAVMEWHPDIILYMLHNYIEPTDDTLQYIVHEAKIHQDIGFLNKMSEMFGL